MDESPDSYAMKPVGVVHSCFREKFGIPRQPGLVPAAEATIELLPPADQPEAVRGLDGFSHLWVVFVFHACPDGKWRPTVRPPRLGGNERVGVFASRSPFRPNRTGLSLVKLEKVVADATGVRLRVSGADLLDGTPVLDLKPYIPYAESVPEASAGFASTAPESRLTVRFSTAAEAAIAARSDLPRLHELIEQLLVLDPRPATRREDDRVYGFRLYDFDVRWRVIGTEAEVVELGTGEAPK
ncbi:MAG: tRNA (N6-threonylcarbamoyladenosine(37)-N6)-methyltransferase TrmO [Victivallales bacterium]|jgi:tRNA (adenine37-N6)-methyltransferase|nr:tRNA (N6-threonylcarbamoyladenosine(37)-N6)-methyltransferase TrmO [Victivallales bacterium]